MSALYTFHSSEERVDLETLTPEQKKLLKQAFDMYLANRHWQDFDVNVLSCKKNQIIAGFDFRSKALLEKSMKKSVTWKIMKDLWLMLGVRQSCVKNTGGDFSAQEEILKNFLK